MEDFSDDEGNQVIGSDGGTEETDFGASDDEGSVGSFDDVATSSPKPGPDLRELTKEADRIWQTSLSSAASEVVPRSMPVGKRVISDEYFTHYSEVEKRVSIDMRMLVKDIWV